MIQARKKPQPLDEAALYEYAVSGARPPDAHRS